MDNELFSKLEGYEKIFNYAIKSNFLRMSPTEFNDIAALYKEVFGTALTKSQMTCPTCRLNAVQKLGKEYFKEKEEKVEEVKEEEKEDEEQE